MNTLIGHNQPPKNRKKDWKSISINIYVYKDLLKIAQNICDHKNCFRLLDGEAPIENVSIPYAIELLANQKLTDINRYEMQDNGRNIWEQTAKKLLRSYNSKKGQKLNAK
tara:strand:- start:149 stop:478 length:330 start_codon:yes stop_codon:yes gene_type:complete